MKSSQYKLEPFARIARAGFDIRFKQSAGSTWTICLMRGGVAVACTTCPRSSYYSLAEAEERSRASGWSYGSVVTKALEQLADTAEGTLLDPARYAEMCELVRKAGGAQ